MKASIPIFEDLMITAWVCFIAAEKQFDYRDGDEISCVDGGSCLEHVLLSGRANGHYGLSQ
jgi:hypothetical protein